MSSGAGRKMKKKNRIAGAGMFVQLVIAGEQCWVADLPGEEEHMQSPGWDGGCL